MMWIIGSSPCRVFIGWTLLLWSIVTGLSASNSNSDSSSYASSGEQIHTIPVIDISALLRSQDYGLKNETHLEEERWKVSKEIGRACETIGFFAISNHGVDPLILDAAWNVTRDFFDLPSHQKRSLISHDTAEYPYGYEASESLSRGKKQRIQPENTAEEEEDHPDDLVDWKETFAIGPKPSILNGMPARQFPQAEPKEMRSAYELYFEAMEHLTMHLLGAFAMALDLPHDNEKHWFHDKMDHHMCALRALNYPHVPHDTLQNAPPGQWRAGPHTDYGALTILKSGGPGLQVLAVHKNDNDDNDPTSSESYWVDVPYMPDKFIINIGDMMQRWTNDKWVSTLHRVVVPSPVDNDDNNRRQSMAFFVNINGDAEVVPIETCVDDEHPAKYEMVTAGQYLMQKHLASMGEPFKSHENLDDASLLPLDEL